MSRKLMMAIRPMRIIIVLCLLLISNIAHSQSLPEEVIDSIVTQLKKRNITDKRDLRVFSLLDKFYEEALQSDKGTLSAKTINTVERYSSDKHLKNNHLFTLFFMYQQLVTNAAGNGTTLNPAIQLACIKKLETEMLTVYNSVPVIVYIYKAEALESAGQKEEAKSLVEHTLEKFPDSIPLKVYRYLDTKDEQLKIDLAQNHSQHWMVKQNRIGS